MSPNLRHLTIMHNPSLGVKHNRDLTVKNFLFTWLYTQKPGGLLPAVQKIAFTQNKNVKKKKKKTQNKKRALNLLSCIDSSKHWAKVERLSEWVIGGVLLGDQRDVRGPDFAEDMGFVFDLGDDAVVVKVKPFTAGRKRWVIGGAEDLHYWKTGRKSS